MNGFKKSVMKTSVTRGWKLFGMGVLLAVAMPVFVSCGRLSVDTVVINAGRGGGSHTVAVTSNAEWMASADVEWITFAPASGKGDGTLTVNVAENSTLKVRSATISVATVHGFPAGKIVDTVTVTQAAASGVRFTFTGTNVSIRATARNMIVSWGDGATEEYTALANAVISHLYGKNTTCTVHIQADTLDYFDCHGQGVTALEVGDCAKLICTGNPLGALDVSSNVALTWLECSGNQLGALDVSSNVALMRLVCSYNQLDVLDVSSNVALTHLECHTNQLSALDVSRNTVLSELRCNDNLLGALDVSGNTVLRELCCNDNLLGALDVSSNTMLGELQCRNNRLSALDVSRDTVLVTLICSNNQLSTLNVLKNAMLKHLDCSNNQLRTLDLSWNAALIQLDCSDNQLNNVFWAPNETLTHVKCNNNRFTALDMYRSKALLELECRGNQLDGAQFNSLFHSLPNRFGKTAGRVDIRDNLERGTMNASIATNKNWIVVRQ
jgi:hypothetical protein